MTADDSAAEAGVRDALMRIAEALERLQPAPADFDWAKRTAATWRCHGFQAAEAVRSAGLADLLGVDAQKRAVVDNTRQFLAGLPANNVLLWGARGTGKSTLVHALLSAHAADGLRVVQVERERLFELPDIAGRLAGQPYRFIVFCDDLAFEADDAGYKALKSALEGSLSAACDNVLIYATSNRRHLLPEHFDDNRAAAVGDGELHPADVVEEKLSLADRFGLWVAFRGFRQEDYLGIARHWVERLAQRHAVAVSFDDAAAAAALRFALGRGGRSGRIAEQFARHWVGSLGLPSRAPHE